MPLVHACNNVFYTCECIEMQLLYRSREELELVVSHMKFF